MSCGPPASRSRSEGRVWFSSSSSPADRPSTTRNAKGSSSASRHARNTATSANHWARDAVAASTRGRLVSSTPGPGPLSRPWASDTWNSVNGQAATRTRRLSPPASSVWHTSSGSAKRSSPESAGSSARVRNWWLRSATSRRMAGVRKPCCGVMPAGPSWPSNGRVIGLSLYGLIGPYYLIDFNMWSCETIFSPKKPQLTEAPSHAHHGQPLRSRPAPTCGRLPSDQARSAHAHHPSVHGALGRPDKKTLPRLHPHATGDGRAPAARQVAPTDGFLPPLRRAGNGGGSCCEPVAGLRAACAPASAAATDAGRSGAVLRCLRCLPQRLPRYGDHLRARLVLAARTRAARRVRARALSRLPRPVGPRHARRRARDLSCLPLAGGVAAAAGARDGEHAQFL